MKPCGVARLEVYPMQSLGLPFLQGSVCPSQRGLPAPATSCLPRYYPPYARGMAYALSEDVVLPLGTALYEGRIDPVPYREDVSVGLYILELARSGRAACSEAENTSSNLERKWLWQAEGCHWPCKVRVVPHQRKDAMPLESRRHCRVRLAYREDPEPPEPPEPPQA